MRHIGQQTLPSFTHHEGIYTISNVRDFIWESDHAAKQQYTSIEIPLSGIHGCRLYQSTFGYKNIFAHYMIGFLYTDKHGAQREILFSIEARRPEGEEYTLWKGIIPGKYSIIYTRGTPSDLLALRKNIWHEPLRSYDFNINNKDCQDLFMYFAHRTNDILHHSISYHAIRYNCLTDLHKGLSQISKKIFSITGWTIISTGYVGYLKRKGLLV